jgi:hypothetical protein
MIIKTAKQRHERFLKVGFFPEEMPSCFYSVEFAKYRDELLQVFSSLPAARDGSPDYYYFKSSKSNFNFPRHKREDRRFSYMNPISFFFLSKVLADNYVKLRSANRRSLLSVTPSVFDWSGGRSLTNPLFEPRNAQHSSLSARFELLAEADIQGFYHSVYTHTIAWAIHGKDVAKKNQRNYKLYGNLIDLLVRNGQDGQTVGIPVGPDTSRLIAEVLGSAIDQAIQKSIKVRKGSSPRDRNGMRFVDDYTFGCDSLQDAEKTIAAVRLAVNNFELELNNTKTGIRKSAPYVAAAWRDEVRSYLPKSSGSDLRALNRYFYNLQAVAKNNPQIDVAKYGLKVATREFLETNMWPTVQDYLISAYRGSGTVLQTVVETIILRQMARKDIDTLTIGEFINARIRTLADLQKNGEIVWLLFLLVCVGIRLTRAAGRRVVEIEDGAIAILVADANARGLTEDPVKLSFWNKSLTQDGLRSSMWLYAYESTLKKLNGTSGDLHVTGDKYFNELYRRKVEFYRSGNFHMNANDILGKVRLDNLRRQIFKNNLLVNLAEDVEDFEHEVEDLY